MNKRVYLVVLFAAIAVGVVMLVRCQTTGSAGSSNAAATPPATNQHGDAASTGPVLGPEQLLVVARVIVLDHVGVGTTEGDNLLEAARSANGQAVPDDVMRTFSADLATLQGKGQARVLSSPMMMVLSRQDATVTIGKLGATPASAMNLSLDLACTAEPDGSISGRYDLRVVVHTGQVELKLAELGLPVGDRAVIHLDSPVASGQTLLGLRELSSSNDLGAAMILLVSPSILPVAPPESEVAEPPSKPGQPHDSDG